MGGCMKLKLEDIKGMKVLIMGLGLNGGGLESARFFAEKGADVLVTDIKDEVHLSSSVASLSHFKNIHFHLGFHDRSDFRDADLVIKNPGVKREGNEYLSVAKWIESDVAVFASLSPSPIIAVTGTKGKSFTSTAIHYCLSRLGVQAFLAGNLGVSPLRYLESVKTDTPCVMELSSWQLADLKNCEDFHPHIAVVTPIMKDHQNWYGNMESYVKDKSIIYQRQEKNDFLLLNRDDVWSSRMAKDARAKVCWYTKKAECGVEEKERYAYIDEAGRGILLCEGTERVLLTKDSVKVKGIEARQNLLNAALVAYLMGFDVNCIREVVEDFEGIEHRMECFLQTKNNITFYNDSAATIPEASCVAISAFLDSSSSKAKAVKNTAESENSSCHPIWIGGGTDKLLDFSPLAKVVKNAKKIFLLKGSATEKMLKIFDAEQIDYYGPYEDLEVLLAELKREVRAGDNVVFSPASASFELFKNEFDRGNTFKRLVQEMFC